MKCDSHNLGCFTISDILVRVYKEFNNAVFAEFG